MKDSGFSPTTGFWQAIGDRAVTPPYRDRYPARLPDGRVLELPLRGVPGNPDAAVASLIANQASFEVVRTLAGFMTGLAAEFAPEAIVGLPTLGLAFAPFVAEGLGFPSYVPLGYSRKYWYDEALSVPVQSLTTPGAGKRLYVDPNLLPRVRGMRVVVIDDAVSSGTTAAASLALLAAIGATPLGIVAAMLQGNAWRARLAAVEASWPDRVRGVFVSPRFARTAAGWVPTDE
jgi:adenine/guanine phosphoribosyltransferase-like PRPP-binding protein